MALGLTGQASPPQLLRVHNEGVRDDCAAEERWRVDDANVACAELAQRGVELINGPVNRGLGMRTAAFSDPDGHIWEIAEELSPAEGS